MNPNQVWPELRYDDWKDTCNTLQRWLQIAGKVRTNLAPWTNHGWHATYYPTSRGLTTSLIPFGIKSFSIDFDFVAHRLVIRVTDGAERQFELKSESVASFYERFCAALSEFGIPTDYIVAPNEVADATPFAQDTVHCTYDGASAHRFWQAVVQSHRVLLDFRSRFVGKCSPVHFFWGGLDLAVTRFSGRRAPEHPGGFPHLPDEVTREAYSFEVSSCGFWPGNAQLPEPGFYSYAYPQPEGFENARVTPNAAYFHPTLREFILPYEAVRKSHIADDLLFSFFQTTYEAASNLGKWDRDLLENSSHLEALQRKQRAFLAGVKGKAA